MDKCFETGTATGSRVFFYWKGMLYQGKVIHTYQESLIDVEMLWILATDGTYHTRRNQLGEVTKDPLKEVLKSEFDKVTKTKNALMFVLTKSDNTPHIVSSVGYEFLYVHAHGRHPKTNPDNQTTKISFTNVQKFWTTL